MRSALLRLRQFSAKSPILPRIILLNHEGGNFAPKSEKRRYSEPRNEPGDPQWCNDYMKPARLVRVSGHCPPLELPGRRRFAAENASLPGYTDLNSFRPTGRLSSAL